MNDPRAITPPEKPWPAGPHSIELIVEVDIELDDGGRVHVHGVDGAPVCEPAREWIEQTFGKRLRAEACR